MTIDVYDNVFEIEDAKRIEEYITQKEKYKWGAFSVAKPRKFYPPHLPKGLKWGEWEPIERYVGAPNRHWKNDSAKNWSVDAPGALKILEDDKNQKWKASIWYGLLEKLQLKKKYHVVDMLDCYIGVHTYGQAPYCHSDNGNFTLIYYPVLEWERNWGGGTTIWEPAIEKIEDFEKMEISKHVLYKGNRCVIFDGFLHHRAEPVARECKKARYALVYKCVAENERLDYYGENIDGG